jgi:hypothetical protein
MSLGVDISSVLILALFFMSRKWGSYLKDLAVVA